MNQKETFEHVRYGWDDAQAAGKDPVALTFTR